MNRLILEISRKLNSRESVEYSAGRNRPNVFQSGVLTRIHPNFRAAVGELVIHMPVIVFLRPAMREARRPAAS
jgi:hypothetical protein